MPDENKPIDQIVRDMNRHVLGGARRFNPAKNKWQPAGVLTGQQAQIPMDQPTFARNQDKHFEFYKNGVPIPGSDVTITGTQIDKAYVGVHAALTGSPQEFFNLTEDKDIPTWIASPKQFNLTSNPAPEEIVHLNGWDVLALPPTVLVEAIGSEPAISLCTYPAKQRTIKLSPVPWKPAMILRCPVTIAKKKAKIPPASSASADPLVFELKGIPQGQRWYLDKLKLLDTIEPTTTFDIQIFVENPDDKKQPPVEVLEWTIARENLSGLARPSGDSEPGMNSHLADVPLPYAASSDAPLDTMRLFQMASIVNDGGYYFRVLNPELDRSTVSGDGVVLVIVLLLAAPPASSKDLSGKLPMSANAIAYSTVAGKKPKDTDEVHRVIRFGGLEHSQFSPSSSPGCLTFGWVRGMNWVLDEKLDITTDPTGHAFAESLHLIDYEIRDPAANNDIIQSWIRNQDAINFDLSKNWRNRPCSADTVTPLSPTHQVGMTDDGDSCQRFPKTTGQGTAVAYYSNLDTRQVKQSKDYHEHRYRTTVRYAFADVYGRMRLGQQGTNNATLNLTGGFRDLYGNRIYPNCASATRTIAYTDALIPLSEWPNFHFKACAHAGNLCVKIWYARKDPSSFSMGQLRDPKAFAKLIQSTQQTRESSQAIPHVDCLAYLRRRLTDETLDWVQKASPQEKIAAERQLVQRLNGIVDGPNIYQERWFQHISMRPEIELLLAKHPSGPALRRLNRMLLEDIFPHEIAQSKLDSEASLVQQLEKLSLIADQLTGAGRPDSPDISVNLIDVGRDPVESPPLSGADDRGNFQYGQPSLDLRQGLIAYIRNILANASQVSQPPLSFSMSVQAVSPDPHAGPCAFRLSPLLQITRSAASPNLPQNDLPSDQDLSNRILRQIRYGETRIPFGLYGDDKDDSDVEFKDIALTFSTDLSQGMGFQTAMTRNRFNEHEIWFVPITAFPTANPDADVLYSTARPLGVSLQTESFAHPDFSSHTGRRKRDDFDPWHGFPVPSTNVKHAGVDCDALARRAFSALERFLAPKCVTEVVSPSAKPLVPILPELLASKDALANTLASVGNCIVPMFIETDISKAASGINRMAADAFERSLRAFYRIDTFVSLPVSKPILPAANSAAPKIGNFFGQTTADFTFDDASNQPPGKQPAMPTLSDFVLSAATDFRHDATGYITVAYNHHLKQGHEADWIKWHLSTVKSFITHVQLAVPGEEASHPFDMGRWLEFVFPPGSEVALKWTFTHPIPAIIRAIPVEPVLQAVTQLKFDALDGQAIPTADLQHCVRWGWQVDFGGVYTENDTVCLEIDYFNDSGNPPPPAKALNAKGAWPGPQNLTQTLIVLDLLMAMPAWFDPNTSAEKLENLSEAAAELLKDLTTQLCSTAGVKKSREQITQDNYQLRVSQAYPGPGTGNPILISQPPDLRMKEIYFSSTKANPAGNFFNYSIKAPVSRDNAGLNALRLFGGTLDAKAFRPVLMLRRNDAIPEVLNLSSLHTTPSLVYKSGPVTWPNRVRVTNKWRSISVNDAPGAKLLTVLQNALIALFSNDTDFSQKKMTLRFDLRHCFKLGPPGSQIVAPVNPIYLYSNDYKYTNHEDLAISMANIYCSWLKKQGGTEEGQLAAMNSPTLQIGVQAAKLVNGVAVPGHIMLEMGTLEIPMDKLDWGSKLWAL